MTESMVYWVKNADIDGFRCDVAGLVPTDFWNDTRRELTPEDAGLPRAQPGALRGGDGEVNAKTLLDVLKGKKSAYRDVSLINAAAALVVAGKAKDIKEGVALAAKSVDSSEAEGRLQRLIKVSNAA